MEPVTFTMIDHRIVLEHTADGPMKGLFQILGAKSQLPPHDTLPEIEEIVNGNGEPSAASLVTVKRRYVLYREVIVPVGLRGFDARQR